MIRRAHATMSALWTAEGLDDGQRRAAWTAYARDRLLPRLRGVERLLAPWAIASLRLAMLLEETGFAGQVDTPIMILGDTLADADALARPISVVLGNPPYGREAPGSLGGGWIRGRRGAEQRAPLADFIEPARAAGAGAHVKNLYNLYVYFWRWACWQVFERRPQAPGVVAMVTAASFLRGPGFAGMRAHMRGCCSQVWLLDLEGDQRGAVASDNVFAVSVPVAATTLVRDGLAQRTGDVMRHRAAGGRADKLALCARTRSLADLTWTRVGDSSGAAWTGGEDEAFHAWPRLVDLFPWSRAIEPQRPSPQGEEGQIGLLVARETRDGRHLYFKDGQTAGFSSYLLFSTSPQAAVVLLTNAGDLAEAGTLKVLAREILDALPSE